ncbi:MAG TPA: hypothetical protein VMF03_07610 [Steroidobacteraceae bacterium]|nr:hypothetical protein [Steroidobacteraceae bacterium]
MPQLTRLESELRKLARELIRDGRLPDQAPERAWAGAGSGKPCALCGETVPASDVEYEVDIGTEKGRRTLHFHFGCHAAWQLECLRADFTAHADAKAPARPGMTRSKRNPTQNERALLPRRRWVLAPSS